MAEKHGMSDSSEYRSWFHMKNRCFNTNNKDYSRYGGRGISVCDRWKNSFQNFFADMGLKPSPKHSIDRIDNNGDYFAENCKWSTHKEQVNNRNSNRLITIKNETLTMAQWAEKMGFGESVIWQRLNLGWSEYDAVMTPLETVRLITIEGETYTVSQLEEKKGYSREFIKTRLTRGWSEFDAVMTPVRQRKTA